MNEEHIVDHETERHPTAHRRQLLTFICGSIVIAMCLVMVSMALYASSGAAQLDLSRPGYKSVQDKVYQSDTFESFPASGGVDNGTLDQFLKLYKKQVKPVDNSDVFSPNTLDDQALGIDDPTDANQ